METEKVTTWIWADGTALEMAEYYTGLIPDSRIVEVYRVGGENPCTDDGAVVTVTFELAGRTFTLLNGGPRFPLSEAVSLQVMCEDQAEVDRYWDAFTADGGEESQCGWCKDRWGLSWQVIPRRLGELMRLPDRDRVRRVTDALLQMHKIDIAALERAADGAG